MYYVYRHIRVDKNQPFYIGIETKPKFYTCWGDEYRRAYNKKNRSSIWKNIIAKTLYKVEIILESNDLAFIKEKEIELILLYGRRDLGKGSLCNLTDGGDGVLNIKFSEELKKRISESKKGHIPWNKGIEMTTEIKEKISISVKEKMRNEEISKKISNTHSIKVIQVLSNKEKEWDSIHAAAKELGIDRGDITKVCKGKRKTCGGSSWIYKN